MIKDKLFYAETYYALSKNLKKGFEWLKFHDLLNIECKKYEIDGDRIYANVQEYETKEDADFEAHRKYIDIQYIVKGREYIGVSDLASCRPCGEYDDNKDIEFLTCGGEAKYQVLNEGEFMVLYPHDAHKPSINPGEKTFVKKVVIKVKIQ